MPTSNPVLALLQGALLGAGMIVFLWAVDPGIDWRLGAILFLCGLWSGAVYSFDWRRFREERRARNVDLLMQHVCWNFAQSAPDELSAFIQSVEREQPIGQPWIADRFICPPGSVIIEIEQLWRDEGDELQELTLEPRDENLWTEGHLLFALHQALKSWSLGDHSFFEGLIRREASRFRLLLGS